MSAAAGEAPSAPKLADIDIRPERAGDQAAIHDLTRRAFAPMPYSDGDEQHLLDALRNEGALTLSLVAEQAGEIVGHIAFSPGYPADGSAGWYALGPVSAEPAMQRRGIGSRLIETGLELLRERKAAGCILVGDPAYYSRFGFRVRADMAPDDQPKDYYQILPLDDAGADCVIDFHPLFRADDAPETSADTGE